MRVIEKFRTSAKELSVSTAKVTKNKKEQLVLLREVVSRKRVKERRTNILTRQVQRSWPSVITPHPEWYGPVR